MENIPQGSDQSWEAIKRQEIEEWSDETRLQWYKDTIGQEAPKDWTQEQITEAIIHPEEERERLRRENKEEDRSENMRNYRR